MDTDEDGNMPSVLRVMPENERSKILAFAKQLGGLTLMKRNDQLANQFGISNEEALSVLKWLSTQHESSDQKLVNARKEGITLEPNCTQVSIQGGRSKNEDTAEYQRIEDPDWGLLIFAMVADGHGGAGVSKMLKRETWSLFSTHFKSQKITEKTIPVLDQLMINSLKHMNVKLQNICRSRNLTGGSTLVGVFAFLTLNRVYVLNVGDSRFLMFETKTGDIIKSTHRIIDTEDGKDTPYPNLHPTQTYLHKVLGKIKIKRNVPLPLKNLESKPGTWDREIYDKGFVSMLNDTPDCRGLREWMLFLSNKETNSSNALEFVNHRPSDEELVFGHRQLPSTTRAFGDAGMTLHNGEIYICSIPTDREVAMFIGCDGFEESINVSLIPKYLSNPKKQLAGLLSPDHKFVSMYHSYTEWFKQQKIGDFPKNGIVSQLNWLLKCVQMVGHSHLPSNRDCEVIAGAVQWLQWAYNKYSSLDESDSNNKFTKEFPASARFRLKFLVQCALARLSFDNISGVLVTTTPRRAD